MKDEPIKFPTVPGVVVKRRGFFAEWYHRLKLKAPPFFKKIKRIGQALTGAAATVLTPDIIGVELPPLLVKIATHLATAGIVMIAVAAATRDPEKSPGDPSLKIETSES